VTKEPAARCSFCDSTAMSEIMDFGRVALAGAFLKPEQFATEKTYPLRLYFCRVCFAVQIADKVDANVLFDDYFYFSSSIRTLRDHFQEYAAEITSRFLKPAQSTVIEFGCNDGILLRPLADQGIRTVIGVDPATNVVRTIDDPRITVINDFFTEDVADQIVARHGKADMVMANNVYAHIPDIQGITRAVRTVLKDDGVFAFEVHYLGKVINEMQYDMIYHEHLYYYSLLSAINHFARYDMVVFDVKPVPIHAGSMRFYVCTKGSRYAKRIEASVMALRDEERANGFNRAETFASFAADVAERKAQLMALLNRLKAEGERVAGYGASGRANTMIQYCGIDHDHMEYMIDDAPAKAGFYTPGSHFVVHPSAILQEGSPPGYLLVFAWSFLDEIARKNRSYLDNGGRMIVPLPDVRVIESPPTPEARESGPILGGASK
jgi:methylation protein EvaC